MRRLQLVIEQLLISAARDRSTAQDREVISGYQREQIRRLRSELNRLREIVGLDRHDDEPLQQSSEDEGTTTEEPGDEEESVV